MRDLLRVECRLASPFGGDAPPHLDSLLELVLSLHHPKGEDRSKIDRSRPAPPMAAIPIPIVRQTLGEWSVARCSSPIFLGQFDRHEHYVKKLAVEHAAMLESKSRTVVNTTGGEHKSYRLPIRVRQIDRVVWFAEGNRREVLSVLRRLNFLGKKTSQGYGKIADWNVERIDFDAVWFAQSTHQQVLMRPLPVGPWLPDGLIGARKDFGACCPPYWHPDRYGEIVTPC